MYNYEAIISLEIEDKFLYYIKIPSIEYAKIGFWINEDFLYTDGSDSDCKYWIPPSQIKYVEKRH